MVEVVGINVSSSKPLKTRYILRTWQVITIGGKTNIRNQMSALLFKKLYTPSKNSQIHKIHQVGIENIITWNHIIAQTSTVIKIDGLN